MSPRAKAEAASLPDYEARARVANTLLQSCRPERYVYLAFAGLAALGVLAALVWIVVNKQSGSLEIGALTSCSGLITVTGYRILRIQSVVFNAVFGTKL
ncbi:MAG TPA: hypothetical protein VHD85_21070 [Terracidiphilus sp.]|nr:hypothetical protein [Terracidiphilus sp.]